MYIINCIYYYRGYLYPVTVHFHLFGSQPLVRVLEYNHWLGFWNVTVG